MKQLQIVISLLFLFRSIVTLPEKRDDGNSVNDETEQENRQVNYEDVEVVLEDPSLARNGIKPKAFRWQNAIVPYVISSSYSSYYRNLIMDAFKHIQDRTCVRFVPRTNQVAYVKIENRDGCRSLIGRMGRAQLLNLESGFCFNTIGAALHEILHTLGFVHEHTRPDRDSFVKINMENIRDGKKQDFAKKKDTIIDTFGVPYDYYSIMHYSMQAASRNGRKTIEPLQNVGGIGMREDLSPSDVLKIQRMYNCSI